uniref:Leucine-rich repeat-containing N-terminal plant-type domain-containing protein n=1 Tax=Fagus sylvatica TaxID=28930 RepID=A0A2N9J2Z5_FAGSY
MGLSLWPFLLLLLSQVNCSSSLSSFPSPLSMPLCHPDQSSALLQFKNSFSVPHDNLISFHCDIFHGIQSYPKTDSWKNGTNCCAWNGITCDNSTGHVIGIDLSCSQLQGTIHSNSSLFSLHHLQRLNLSYNDFTGSNLLSQFGWFANMTHLNLTTCNLAGQVPSEIAYLSKLVSLDLSWNGNLKLDELSLQRLIQNQTKLSELFFVEADMSLVSPRLFMNLSSSLRSLRLYDCQLKGRFPDNIFHFPNLHLLDVRYNPNLIGSLPKYNWSSPLKSLGLSETGFPIDLPNLISNLKSLRKLYLGGCNFTRLDLSHNQIKGNTPTWMFDVGKDTMKYLNLSNNFLTSIDQLPWKQMGYLDLHSNLLQGPLPVPPLGISFFSISRNKLSGMIPLLICNINSLKVLDLSHNNLSDIIPLCLGNFSDSLSVLDLRNNKFLGTIPKTFARGNSLRSLNLNDNQLEGALPQSLVNCRHLEVLDLGNNKINDTFPHWLGTLPNLRVLVLRKNRFQGPIGNPRTKFAFTNLRIIDLSHNEFHGQFPTNCFDHFKAMMNASTEKGELKYIGENYYLDSVIVVMKGLSMELVKIQNLFTTIDFSNNSFKGEIPDSIGELKSLKGLNLSHNKLESHMPSSLGKLTNLEWLDLSSNKLIGEIPIKLVDLTSLEVLNLSGNCLVGPIPQGNQFNTFSNDSYSGNLHLCGFPLTRSCGDDKGNQSLPSSTILKDDLKFWFHWKVILLGYGCGLLLGLGMGYLVFTTGKPKWLVNMVEGKQHNEHNKLR